MSSKLDKTIITHVTSDTDHTITVERSHLSENDQRGWRDSAFYNISFGGQTIQGMRDEEIRTLKEIIEALDRGSF